MHVHEYTVISFAWAGGRVWLVDFCACGWWRYRY